MSKVIELAPYITVGRYHRGSGLWDREQGLKAAKDHNFLADMPTDVTFKIPPGIPMDDSFLKALLGPLARKVGVENLKVTVVGGHSGGSLHGYYNRCPSTARQVEEYLVLESIAVKKRQEEKAKAAQGAK